MALPRQSAFLPTIKCSSCGRDIEISMMGDHICGKPDAPSEPMPVPPANFDDFMPYNKKVHEKIGRVPPPPKVDTSVANRSYYRAGQLTPISNSSGSRSVSPKTPVERPGAGRSDNYFAPKIANEYDSTPPQQSRRPGGYGGFSDNDILDMDPMYPASPKKQAPSLLSRMNTLAPGPFEVNKKPASRNAFPSRGNEMNSSDDDRDFSRSPRSQSRNGRPGTAASMRSNGSGPAPPRVPRKGGYEGFGPRLRQDDFEPEPFGPNNRAGTFPRQSPAADPPLRTPSAPGARPDRFRRPSNAPSDVSRPVMNEDRYRRPSMAPDTSRPPPPRTSVVRPRTSGRDTANLNLAAEFGIGNPYHTPNDSTSSSASSHSRPSQASSQSSPQRSISSRLGRNPSNNSQASSFDNLMNDLQSLSDKSLPEPPPFEKPPQSLRTRSRPPTENRYNSSSQMNRNRSRSRPRSPMGGSNWDAPRGRDQTSRYDSSPERLQRSRSLSRGRAPGLNPSRGICKACGDPISGKAISSADGQLTGRYHKACFVCTTCSSPFTTATTYVFDDKPYCERHYHEMNGSLCGSCGDGIEGQYLADENDKKYHPECFICGDCGDPLRDGYFEINGKAYCEKDAMKRAQPVFLPIPGRRSNMPPTPLGPGLRGMPSTPGMGFGLPSRPGAIGLPGSRPGPRMKMEKRMTRLGMM